MTTTCYDPPRICSRGAVTANIRTYTTRAPGPPAILENASGSTTVPGGSSRDVDEDQVDHDDEDERDQEEDPATSKAAGVAKKAISGWIGFGTCP